jgi:hypothetical protein
MEPSGHYDQERWATIQNWAKKITNVWSLGLMRFINRYLQDTFSSWTESAGGICSVNVLRYMTIS